MNIENINKSNILLIIKSYFELCKPNVMYLAILSSIAGMFLAQNQISLINSIFSVIFISVGAGSAGAFNMYFEADIDKLMYRTSKRPLPSWRIKKINGLYFAIITSIISILGLYFSSNILSAFLLFLTIVFYAFIYTLILKKRTIYNIVIGGIPGAIPPLIGSSVMDNSISLPAWSLFFIIFFWIPPHSWALALFKLDEYKKVNIPMLPVIKGRKNTSIQIIIYSFLLLVSSYSLYFTGFLNFAYLILITILNIIFMYFAFKIYFFETKNNIYEKKLFFFSINYLFLIFLYVIFEKIFLLKLLKIFL